MLVTPSLQAPVLLFFNPNSLYFHSLIFPLSLTLIKHSLTLPPPPRLVLQHTAAKLLKKPLKKKRKKLCLYDSPFPPYLTGSSRSSCVFWPSGAKGGSRCLSDRELHRGFSVTGVNDHVNCCHSTRAADCCSRRFMPRRGFSFSMSLSLFRQAGRGRVSTSTIWLNGSSQPLPPQSLYPASSCPPACV